MKIINYKDGNEFIKDNIDFLNTNKYQTAFFILDAPLLKESNLENYALKIENDNKKAIVLKVEPFNVMFFGNKELTEELLAYMYMNRLSCDRFIVNDDLGKEITKVMANEYDKFFTKTLSMDFMEAKRIDSPSDPKVVHATLEDIDEIFDMTKEFIVDCGLYDEPNKEFVINNIDTFRILKSGSKILSMARISDNDEFSKRISYVHTRRKERGKGYAKKVVTTCKNEAIENGFNAVLNVDQHNPISNHLYSSIGFKKVYSHGEYRLLEK